MVDKVISSIIALQNIDLFSAVEIKTAYIAVKKDEQLNPASVRRFVYEELLKLVKKGWLTKSTTKKKGLTRYSKTDLFEYDYFNNVVSSDEVGNSSVTNRLSCYQTLTTRLNQYNTELLEGLGAIKEYVALKEIYPELHAPLKQRYMAVQENNHILKGKIAVLNELMKSNKET